MSAAGAVLGAVVAGALGLFVPRLIAAVPEPADPAEDKVPYADIAAARHIALWAALASAVCGGLIGLSLGVDWALVFLLPLVPVGVALALVDWRTRLLPTRVIAPTYAVLVPLVVLAALADGEPRALRMAAIGWAAMGGFYVLLWLIHPAGMGYGDVRLSGILGIVLGYLGLGPLTLGIFSGFLLGGIGGVVLVLLRFVDRRHNPFGPWMLLGALVGVVAGPSFGEWYFGHLGR